MAKFEKKSSESTSTAPQPQKTQENAAEKAGVNDPAMVVAQSNDMVKAVGDVVVQQDPKKDDDPITHHPTKDYEIGDNAYRINGLRQFQPDQLTRALNCTMFILDEQKLWGPNPLGGPPIPVSFTREFPEIKALYDSFDQQPADELVALKRKMAHDHGYIYLCQWPGNTLNQATLDKQLADEREALKK